MIETVASVALPIDETLSIKKNRILLQEPLKGDEKRISIITGVHGDELEGQYVCYEVIRKIKEHPEHLHGIVDIYPDMNPLGINTIMRGIPAFDLDMNRIFPGNNDGSMNEYLAAKLVDDIKGSDIAIDIHASNIFLKEAPQIRINEITKDELVPYAKFLNVDLIWVHASSTVLESTLAYSLNSIGTKTLVVETGVGMRITKEYGKRLTDGIFALMKELGIWNGDIVEPCEPIVSDDGKVAYLNAVASGIFIPHVNHWCNVKEGDHIGDIINPLSGEIVDYIKAPCDGILFTLREYPVVDSGSLVARILEA